LVFLIQISNPLIGEKVVVAALRKQKIGITLKLIQFGQFSVDVVFVEVLRPIGPEPGRHIVFAKVLASEQAVEGFVAPAELVERALVVATWAADFLGWAGAAATHADRHGQYGRRRQHFFDPHLVLPVVAEVVGIRELVVDPPREIAQVNAAGIIGIPRAAGVAQALVLAPEVKAVQVPVLPAHHHLENMV
jgi:hypothetical protein